MIDERAAERERVAREMIADTPEVWNRVCHIDDVTHNALVKRIAALMAATEAAVLEEAAKVAETYGVYPQLNVYGGGPEWYQHGLRIAYALRQLAKERRS